ncbi:MAG: hypothetical protein PUP92_37945, partial [Rhizonema sp. PD38]|nr:hypothetical protein [Rhizonema sp. PD38]
EETHFGDACGRQRQSNSVIRSQKALISRQGMRSQKIKLNNFGRKKESTYDFFNTVAQSLPDGRFHPASFDPKSNKKVEQLGEW